MKWVDIGIASGVITAVIGAGYAIAKLMHSFWDGFKLAVREATQDIRDELDAQGKKSDVRHAENVGHFEKLDARVCVVEKDLKEHMKDAALDRARNQGDGK